MPTADRLIPIGETAAILGVSVETVRNWERDGKIAASRTPTGQRRFWLSEVNALLAARPTPEPAA